MPNIELKQHTLGHNNMQLTFLATQHFDAPINADFRLQAMILTEEVILGGTVHYCIYLYEHLYTFISCLLNDK